MAQEIIEAPITGTVISIEVKVGDMVNEGDILLHIESMKMENPIIATAGGKIVAIKCVLKQVVETNMPLVVIET
jgi:biotin carboxyl carrier protein